MTTNTPRNTLPPTPFLGLAPFLRKSIAGTDLRPICQEMLNQAGRQPDDANLWMNLSIAMFCLEQRDVGLAMQAQALEMQWVFHLAATEQPARFRLLILMAPGDLATNTPLECLLENCDIDLELYYVSAGNPLAAPIPEHDALIVALSEDEANREYLAALEAALADWPKPVINAPQHIRNTERSVASQLLQNIPGLLIPPTRQLARQALEAVSCGQQRLPELLADCDFPVILRPVGSHAGHDLEKILPPQEMAAYLEACRLLTETLARVADKWTVLVMAELARGPQRYRELQRMVPGISQRMLTLTLRGLERDGLVSRTVFPTIPPRVDYAVTDLGRTLINPLWNLYCWARDNRCATAEARQRFDAAD